MLTRHVPGNGPVDGANAAIWYDLVDPTDEEIRSVEQACGVTPPTPKPLSVCPVAFCAPGRASSARLSQPDSVWPGAVIPDSSTS